MPLDLYTFAYYLVGLSLIDGILTPVGIEYFDQEELSGYSEKVMEKYGYIGWFILRILVAIPLILIALLTSQILGETLVYNVLTYLILAVFGLIALIDILIVGMEAWEKF